MIGGDAARPPSNRVGGIRWLGPLQHLPFATEATNGP